MMHDGVRDDDDEDGDGDGDGREMLLPATIRLKATKC